MLCWTPMDRVESNTTRVRGVIWIKVYRRLVHGSVYHPLTCVLRVKKIKFQFMYERRHDGNNVPCQLPTREYVDLVGAE